MFFFILIESIWLVILKIATGNAIEEKANLF